MSEERWLWQGNSRLYTDPDVKWYCHSCYERTRVEANPEWEAAGRPRRWPKGSPLDSVKWYVRCAECQKQFFSPGQYSCPDCGACGTEPGYDEGLLHVLAYSKPRHMLWASYEYGVNGQEWDETVCCLLCGTVFTYMNANC